MTTDSPWATLAAAITRLTDRVDMLPTVREATIADDSPLSVLFDTDTVPVNVYGSLAGGLKAGDRVLTLKLRHYVWILGAKGGSAGAESGDIKWSAAVNPTAGWLRADGSVYDPILYPTLYAAIGTTYGGTSGAPLLPNLKGRTPVGLDTSQTEFNTLGKTGGAKTHTLSVSEMPSHNHGGATGTTSPKYGGSWSDQGSSSTRPRAGSDSSARYTTTLQGNSHNHTIPSQGGGGAHNNLQPYLVLNAFIKT